MKFSRSPAGFATMAAGVRRMPRVSMASRTARASRAMVGKKRSPTHTATVMRPVRPKDCNAKASSPRYVVEMSAAANMAVGNRRASMSKQAPTGMKKGPPRMQAREISEIAA